MPVYPDFARDAALAAIEKFPHPVGTPVRVMRIMKPAFESVTLTLPWKQGSTAMIMAAGWTGPVPLDMVRVDETRRSPPPKRLLRVYWCDPADDSPATELPEDTLAFGYLHHAPPAEFVMPVGGSLRPLHVIGAQYDHMVFEAPDAVGPCVVVIPGLGGTGTWMAAILETKADRLARLEAHLAAISTR